jgi:ubiquitin-protein ligase
VSEKPKNLSSCLIHLCRSPPETAWEGATLKVAIEYTEEYPVKPPSVRFISQVFHPNGTVTNETFCCGS